MAREGKNDKPADSRGRVGGKAIEGLASVRVCARNEDGRREADKEREEGGRLMSTCTRLAGLLIAPKWVELSVRVKW